MGFFNRILKIGEANANAALDSIEDPVKMTDQGIRDMKVKLDESIKALAEVKAMAIRSKNECNSLRNGMQEYENKAIQLIKAAETGKIAPAEADRLATSALEKKEENSRNLQVALNNQKMYEGQVAKLDDVIGRLKQTISKWENEAKTLKARSKVSDATATVNKQLANIDADGTVAMLERMKTKVEEKEALAESYGDIAFENRSIDDEIDSVLESSSSNGSEALAALKAKLTPVTPPIQQ
jgi:phage shock protein A